MKLDSLQRQLEQLNRSGGLTYREMLAGLLAIHGRQIVVRALVENWSGNVVSIASSQNWCRPDPREGHRKAG